MLGRRLSPTTLAVIHYAVAHPDATHASTAEALHLNFNTVHTIYTRHRKRIEAARQQNEEHHDAV